MIKTTAMLLEELKNYASPKDKLALSLIHI